MKRIGSFLLLAGLTACAKFIPPAVAPERPMVRVNATFEATWNAVIDVFAARVLPIQLIDRSSGLIVAAPLSLESDDAMRWASCGVLSSGAAGAVQIPATRVEFNILVRSVDQASTVRITTRWTAQTPPQYLVCQTANVWEAELEARIRTAAEHPAGH